MAERSRDWWEQAERDLASARLQSDGAFYEWACFASHQAAEKAIKAVYQKLGGEAWGHGLMELLEGLRDRVPAPEEVVDCARFLDRFYVPTRYPNAWPRGSPGSHHTREDAERAVRCAETVLRFCHGLLAGP
jgi:HEPN domain-containing protein